jgi:hypothetical protein
MHSRLTRLFAFMSFVKNDQVKNSKRSTASEQSCSVTFIHAIHIKISSINHENILVAQVRIFHPRMSYLEAHIKIYKAITSHLFYVDY